MFKIIILSIIGLSFFYSCTPSKASNNSYITYISYDKITYPPTLNEDVKILNSRLELNIEYKEIGVIKLEGRPKIEDIINLAAKHGAMAIIQEGNNYIMMIYKKGNKDAKYKVI
jgi:hypothetical protein